MRNKFFYGGNGRGIPTAKSLTTGRTWQRMLALFALIVTLGIGQMWGTLTAHIPGIYEKAADKGGYGATLVTVSERQYEVYGFSYNSSGTKPQILWAGTSTNNASASQVLCSNLSATPQEIAGWISMSTAGKSSTYSMPSSTEFAASSVGSTGLYQMKMQGHSLTLKVKGYDQFSFLGNDNNGNKSKNKYLTVSINGSDVTKDVSSSTTVRRYDLTASTEYTIVITGLGSSNEHIDAFSLRLPEAPTCSTEITTQPSGATLAIGDANPELSIEATNVASYAWKESSDGTSHDGASSLGSSASFTPSVNDAVQTKYYYCEVTSSCDGAAVSKSNIVTVNVVGAISYYTVTLNPAGGTIVDATGWTLNAGNYEREVAEGTVLTLPTFTKTNRAFKTWRKAGPADVASPVTVDGDLSLTAIWTATIEQVIYSWEGAEGGAIETGGTAAGNVDNLINQVSAGYYCLKIDGNNSYSGNLVTITLAGEEKVKTGDKIKYWGFYNKSSSANARPKMRDANGSNASIFDDPNNLPNLYSGGNPAERTFTVPADINTSAVQLTRSQTGSNTWIPKLQIIREVQVEEANIRTVTFNYNDGGATASTSVEVASGSKVSAPADPTYAHHRFHEWQLSGVAYDFATAVTADITLVADWTQLYTISFAAGGGSGDAPAAVADKAQDETFTVPANTFTAPEGKEFDKWNDGSADYAPGVTYTVGTANVVLTAQWKALQDKYTVIFKDGDVTLGTKQFDVASNPSDADIDKTKALSTFAAWQKEGEDIALDNAFWAIVEKDATVILTARWEKVYAQDADLEGLVEASGKSADWQTYLTGKGYSFDTEGDISLDSKASGKTYENWPYQGLKMKKEGAYVEGAVQAGKLVAIKLGHMAAAADLKIDGTKVKEATGLDAAEPAGKLNYLYMENEGIFRYETTNAGACVLKAITIGNPYAVSFSNDGDAIANMTFYGEGLTLPTTISGLSGKRFDHWCTDALLAEPVVLDGNGKFWPEAACTLYAAYVPLYEISFDGNGADIVSSMESIYAAEGDEVSVPACTFEKTGHVFESWAYSPSVTMVDATHFTMLGEALVLTAQWADASKVAVIVETSTKYESLADAVAAATNGQTVQLLQNNNVTAQVEVAGKAITLDLAGYKIEYTGTSTLPSGVILVHNGGSLTINDSSNPDAGSIVSGDNAYAAIALTKAGDDAANPAVLVINGGIFTGYYYGITGNGSRPNTQITINGGTITATATNDNLGIYHPQNGTLTINGGTITGYASAIEMRAGTLVITGGTLTATATEYSCNPNGSGTTTVGAAIAISQHTTKKDIAVTISGGTFEGVKAINESNPQVNDPAPQVSMAVTDGDFTGEVSTVDVHEFISGGMYDAPVTNENCAPGYIPASQDPVTGKYGVMPKDGVCLVKIEPTSQTKGTLSGLYADGDELTINLSSGKNLGGSGKYIGVKATENFQEGDVLHLNMSTYQNSQNATAYVYADKDASVFLFDTEEKCDENKDYYITMPAAVNGHKELYIVRTDGNKWNGGPSIMEVTRAMKPMLTAITIDGRAGVIDEANKTVAVQIPFEADLAALAVVPTIVRNAPHATTPEAVISNEGAWIEGDNTYRVMDKDGDYTDYTITLTRDVLKHAVKFYDGETLLETLEVEDGTSIAAGDVPADPEKEDYIFQGWAETAGGDVVEVTSFTISAAKNFYAKWAADGALKLINKTSGAVNEDGYFITGVTATEANSEKAAAWGGTQGATISGTNQLNKVVQYNATTNQTKLQIKVYNTNNSDKYVYIHKIIEGNTTEETVETLTATSKTVVPSEYYEFNNTKNRSFYITTNSTDVKILQVKVIDDGATPMKQAGEAGYSLNLNKGRALYYANSDVTLEGLALQSASNYNVISSIEFQTKKNFSFSISTPVLLKVTTNTAKYYVSQDPNEDGTTATAVTDAGTAEFNLTTTGTWYLVPSTTSNVKYTNIAFELPKCEKPVFNALTNSDLCEGDAFEALDGTGTVTDGGSISYKWYAEGGTDVLGTNATYTPEADGNYYVVALHHVDGFSDNEATSDVVSVTHFASAQITTAPTDVRQEVGEVATLNVVATGKAPLSYQWYTCDDAEGNNPVIIIGAEEDSYSVTVTDGLDQYYKVVVSSGCGEASAIARIVEWVALPQLSVSATTTWDWVNAGENIKLTGETTPKKNEECVLANVKVDGKMPTNDATFNSQALLFYGENVRAKDGGRYYASLGHIKFNAAVSGKVTVEFSDNGTNNRKLKINDALSESSESKTDIKTFSAVVPAGEVTLMGVNSDGTESDQYIRISKIIFEVTPDVSDADYTRDVRQGYYGTICLPNGGVMVGASIYEVAYFGGTSEKVFFDEIVSGEMIAGRPYIFLPREDVTTIGVYYTDEANAAAGSRNGLIGYIGSGDFAIPQNDGNYVIKNNMYLYVNSPSYIVSNRAYLRLSDIPTTEPALAPGCRRIAIGGVHAPTGLDAINADAEQAQKMLIDGKIYIIRGGHVYDAAGQLVK